MHSEIEVGAWVVLVTRGTVVDFPPELYRSSRIASQEAGRWAWTLAGEGSMRVRTPFEGRLEVGDRDIRLERVNESILEWAEPWMCAHWSPEGSPEILAVNDRDAARQWVREEPAAVRLREYFENDWMLSAAFGRGDDEEISQAYLLKRCTGSAAHRSSTQRVQYEVHLIAEFEHDLLACLPGPGDLDRAGVEALVEEHWQELAADPGVLLESRWDLVDYVSLPADPDNP
jgi:hypothetical protein